MIVGELAHGCSGVFFEWVRIMDIWYDLEFES